MECLKCRHASCPSLRYPLKLAIKREIQLSKLGERLVNNCLKGWDSFNRGVQRPFPGRLEVVFLCGRAGLGVYEPA